MLVNVYMFIAWTMQIQQQSKFYASGLSNYPTLTRLTRLFFSILSSLNLTKLHGSKGQTLQYFVLKVTASWLKYEHLQSIYMLWIIAFLIISILWLPDHARSKKNGQAGNQKHFIIKFWWPYTSLILWYTIYQRSW